MLRGLDTSEIENAVSRLKTMIDRPADNGLLMEDERSGTLRLKDDFDKTGFVKFEKAANEGEFIGVDGGSATILDGYTLFNVSGIRAGQAVFHDGKYSSELTPKPSFNLVTVSPGNLKEIYTGYYQDVINEEPQDMPRTIEEGVGRIRSLIEWREVLAAVESMEKGGVLAFDGSLWAGIKGSEVMLARLVKLCREKGIMLCGVSKRSSLAYKGMPAIPMLQMLGETMTGGGPWLFKLDIEGEQEKLFGEPYVASLATKSRFAFKIDISLPDGVKPVDIFSRLAGFSNDPGYMGYPYPLARAHNNVAFSRTEVENLRHLLEREAARSGMDMGKWHLSFQNFHDVLDGGR